MLNITRHLFGRRNIRRILYKSFDKVLTKKENEKLADLLASSKDLKEEKNKIDRLRVKIASMVTGKFNSGFEANIFSKIHLERYPQVFFHMEIILAFRKFAYAAVLMIAFLLLFNLEEHGEIKILSQDKMSIAETLSSEYFYMYDVRQGLEED